MLKHAYLKKYTYRVLYTTYRSLYVLNFHYIVLYHQILVLSNNTSEQARDDVPDRSSLLARDMSYILNIIAKTT